LPSSEVISLPFEFARCACTAAITRSPVGIGQKTVKAATAAINGETLPATINSDFAWQDATNIDAPEIAVALCD
jgi:ribose transport system substrate-binding protein